jgi:hypothetical protein
VTATGERIRYLQGRHVHSCAASTRGVDRARQQQHCQAADALGPVNQNTFDVGGCRRARYQHRIARRLEQRIAVGVMQVANDITGVEQSDKMLREIC